MNFLNAILLAGAAAFLIPLIIHLLNKRRVQTVRWGAMHLLHQALQQRKRNIKVEQLLLLLTRIAIPILLALCLARPVLSFLRQFPGLNKTSLVVVLDNSFSMRAPSDQGTLSDKMRSELRQILEKLPNGSDVSVVLAGNPPRLLLDAPTVALEAITKKLETEPCLAGPFALNDALQLANAELKRMSGASREVLLLSDFQQSDWKNIADGGSVAALDTILKSEPKPLLTFYRGAGELEENLALASVEPSAFVIAREQSIALRVRILNHGKRAYQDIAVHLEADGARLRTTRVSVAPNAETLLTLNQAFDTAGDHAITVRVEGDAFPEDNAYSLVIPVREQVNCLLVKGGSDLGPLSGATDFLEISLAPHQSASTSLKDVIRTSTTDYRQIREKFLDGVEVVMLANVERLNGRQLPDLEEFVKRGGGLIVFVGPDCNSTWYEKEFFRDGKSLFPCFFKGFGHVETGQTPARILNQRHTHPATTYFNDARGLKLQDAAFQHWAKFEKIEGETRSILNLDRGDSLMVEKPFGKGRVIAVATTANAQWNNLPLQPVFVPLMQRIVTYLATQSAAPQSQSCGSMLRASLAKDQGKEAFVLTDPLNETHELKPITDKEGNVYVDYAITQNPGLYELRASTAAKTSAPKRFAFNLNPSESDLTLLSTGKVHDMATRLSASFAENNDDYTRLDRSRRHGTEVWQLLLFALIAFLFLEVFLQQRISRA